MAQDDSLPASVKFRFGWHYTMAFCITSVQIGDEEPVERTFYGLDARDASALAHEWAGGLARPVIGEVTASRLAGRVAELWREGFTREAHAVDAEGERISVFADQACAWSYEGAIRRSCGDFLIDRDPDLGGPDVWLVDFLEEEFERRYPDTVRREKEAWGSWSLEKILADPSRKITGTTMVELAEAVRDQPQTALDDGMSP